MNNIAEFKSVVFAGGGSRCFWQLGFWSTAAPALNLQPSVIASVSAGAAFACFAVSADAEYVLKYFKKVTGLNRKNFYPENLFRKAPMFPHYNMYRDTILHLTDKSAYEKLINGPDIRILITRPPVWMGARLAAFIAVTGYNIEKHIVYPLHPQFSGRIGYKGEIVPIKNCNTREEVADLILQSSCAPPLLPVMKRNNKVVLDGGIIDNVPLFILNNCSGKKLVLLTRSYKKNLVPESDDVVYVQPSEKIRIKKWEYTDPEGLQYVYDLGRRDGELFAKKRLQTALPEKI
jgi:predicted acylesterase/phospholipase RssA